MSKFIFRNSDSLFWDTVMKSTTITLPKSIVEELYKRAREMDMSIEEFLAEIVTRNLDPINRGRKYIEASIELLKQAEKELKDGNLKQASEKIWGACALAVKAHAYVKTGKRITSHGELWEYKNKIAEELGDWVLDVWAHASSMHINFYEEWATPRDIEKALKAVEKLVKAIIKEIHNLSK